ncbi:hypothetical protein BH10CHL1_BH10CHL1_46670 [soil metagenome]
MSINTNFRSFIVIAMLLASLLIVYFPQVSPQLLEQRVAPSSNQVTYISDLDFWQRTPSEKTVTANSHFDLATDLHNVPLKIGDWQGEEVPETNKEVMILLDPVQYVQRLYKNSAGHYIWLSMIGGRSSQPFHAPDICYKADGWQFNTDSHAVKLGDGGELNGLWLEAKKQMPGDSSLTQQIVFYFYLFPNKSRNLSDGIVLFKLTSERYGNAEDTLAMQGDFVRQLFTSAQ